MTGLPTTLFEIVVAFVLSWLLVVAPIRKVQRAIDDFVQRAEARSARARALTGVLRRRARVSLELGREVRAAQVGLKRAEADGAALRRLIQDALAKDRRIFVLNDRPARGIAWIATVDFTLGGMTPPDWPEAARFHIIAGDQSDAEAKLVKRLKVPRACIVELRPERLG